MSNWNWLDDLEHSRYNPFYTFAKQSSIEADKALWEKEKQKPNYEYHGNVIGMIIIAIIMAPIVWFAVLPIRWLYKHIKGEEHISTATQPASNPKDRATSATIVSTSLQQAEGKEIVGEHTAKLAAEPRVGAGMRLSA